MSAKCWKFGDNISTDEIIPVQYMVLTDIKELALHIMENIDPAFASSFQLGEFLVAGENFGYGSSREHAALALKGAGVKAVIAKSFARIFYRNSINVGLPVIVAPEAVDFIEGGDLLELDLRGGRLQNVSKGTDFNFESYPDFILEYLEKDGLINALNSELEEKVI